MFSKYYITFFPSVHLFSQITRLAYAHFALGQPYLPPNQPLATKPLYFFGLLHIIDEVYDHDGDGPGKNPFKRAGTGGRPARGAKPDHPGVFALKVIE
jgi:hypothetical protein